MRAAQPESTRASVAQVIARREWRTATRGLGGYIALSCAAAAASWMILIDVRALRSSGLLVRSDAFATPVATALLVVALYLGLSAAMSVARDRESGTLEVLFYGPVDEISYVIGKTGGLLLAYLTALPVLLACFLFLSLITGFVLEPTTVLSLVLSLVPATAIIALGILLSVGTDRVRNAVILFIGLAAFLIGVTLAYRMVLLAPIDDASSPLLPLRDSLAALDLAIRWISPFAYLERIVAAAAEGAWRTVLIGLAACLAWAGALLALAAIWLRRRGVHHRGE